jgi:glutathione peroxidase
MAAALFAACGLVVAEVDTAMSDPKNTTDAVSATNQPDANADTSAGQTEALGFYALTTHTLQGESASLSQFRGQVALVVNVASKCGHTPQYAGLEALQKELSGKGFTVLGFPSNDFGGQEPGTPEQILEFCSSTYGVTFPMFEKMPVKGENKSEIYRFLTQHFDEPNWNFTKYLIAKDGAVLARFAPGTAPDDAELRKEIEAALAG